ncbi:MAG: polyprenyl synthetase family protein [Candidatus Omnitrophica bacterium]|nr:polyprenyl synthetase family protein [Candidatus Omnitrophota bacterium]
MKQAISLEEIYAPIQEYIPDVEATILNILATSNELARAAIKHFFSSKGKLLRPALCLLAAKFDGEINARAIRIASALEIFHSATLIHDDIIDAAYLRRGVSTVNVKWGPQTAVLVGDFLYDRALRTIFDAGIPKVTSLMYETAEQVCDGEILEAKERNNFNLTEQEYFTIVEKKTASLLAMCVEAGAIAGGLPLDDVLALKQFGMNFGLAFQVVDDCLDFTGEEHEFGKTLGSDADAGVLTLPVIRLISLVNEKQKAEVFRIFKSEDSFEKLQYLKDLFAEYDALDYARQRAREFADRARLELSVFCDSSVKRSFEGLLAYVFDRER